MSKTNKYWYPYEELGSYFRLVNGVLVFSYMNVDGSKDTEEGGVDYHHVSAQVEGFEGFGNKISLDVYLEAVEKDLQSKE